MKKILIYGAGGLGREVLSMLNQMPEFVCIGFLDDSYPVGYRVGDISVLGNVSWLMNCPTDTALVIAVGNPNVKSTIINRILPEWNVSFETVIHPKATIQDAKSVVIGVGSIIGAGVIMTTSITIGSHVLINLNVTIGHDVRIGDCTSVMPGVNLAGHVLIGKETLIGSGSNLINQVSVGDNCMIGAGSVVNHSIPSNKTAAGVPARVIK